MKNEPRFSRKNLFNCPQLRPGNGILFPHKLYSHKFSQVDFSREDSSLQQVTSTRVAFSVCENNVDVGKGFAIFDGYSAYAGGDFLRLRNMVSMYSWIS
jgi:hypothetical protein